MPGWQEEFNKCFSEGCALVEAGKNEEGHKLLLKAARIKPEAWIQLGMEALKDGDWIAAELRFREVLETCPRENIIARAAATNNIGTTLANSGRRVEAMEMFKEALRILPEYADALVNLGLAHKWLGQDAKGIEYIRKGLRCNPHQGQGEFALAMGLLLTGQFEEGWKAYEARWSTENIGIAKVQCPKLEWDGQPPDDKNKRLCLYAEQGMGDVIQMARFLPRIKAQGWTLQVAVHNALVSLFKTMPFVDEVSTLQGSALEFDLQLPMMSLPRVLKLNDEKLFHSEPYIVAPNPVSLGKGHHVGIVWKGNKSHKNDLWRSSRLADWWQLLDAQHDVVWHSLQVADDTSELSLFPKVKVFDTPKDVLETVNRIAGLDMVISVDTGVVHLAAAMGKPTWMLTPFAPDWRWMLRREDSPWYPTLKLYRQEKEFGWDSVIARISRDLFKQPWKTI